ncbi:MAG: hypothetical protein ACK4YV_03065 [Emticicia sp.]
MMAKETLLTNWHFMRWLRLGMGLYAAVVALQLHDPLSGFIATLFLFQAVTNTGCCGAGGCAVPISKRTSAEVKEIDFEEVK